MYRDQTNILHAFLDLCIQIILILHCYNAGWYEEMGLQWHASLPWSITITPQHRLNRSKRCTWEGNYINQDNCTSWLILVKEPTRVYHYFLGLFGVESGSSQVTNILQDCYQVGSHLAGLVTLSGSLNGSDLGRLQPSYFNKNDTYVWTAGKKLPSRTYSWPNANGHQLKIGIQREEDAWANGRGANYGEECVGL